jgi:6 kDa early secretory antigenic target
MPMIGVVTGRDAVSVAALPEGATMAVYSVDSDAVLTATAAVRGTIERLQAESAAMQTHLTQLQSSWTGAAATAFQVVAEEWRATQRQVEDTLASINQALAAAGRQYAEVEAMNTSLFH